MTNELKTKIFESIGEASMCWNPRPEGVFDSTHASKIGDSIVEAVDAAREDEAGKWEAQVVKLKDDIKELVDALDWLLVVKSYRDPNDKGEYYEIEKLGAREEANRLIKKHKNR